MYYFLKTYGCKLNHADSILIDKVMSDAGHSKVNDIGLAELVILNSCAVVDTTADKILKEAKLLKDKGKTVFIGGCLPVVMQDDCKKVSDNIFSPTNVDDLPFLLQKGIAHPIRNNELDKLSLLKDTQIDNNIVPISEGCLGSCTYCVTRLARKGLISFSFSDIVNRIKDVVEAGQKEIQLTSQDLAVYGLDKGNQNLPSLLNSIADIKGDFMVKLGMMNPGWAMKIVDPLIEALQNSHYYKFLHLPLQSGDDYLLSKMNRGYEVNDYLEVVSRFRDSFEETVLATDIIVGHPLETQEMFLHTIEVLRETKPDIIHIFKFSRRPGTSDWSLKDLPDRIKKERSRLVTKLFHEINEKRNRNYAGKEEKVLIIEKRGETLLCRNIAGRAVIIKSHNLQPGRWINVRITDSRWNYLLAEPSFSNY
ncbi:MAG: tRNA (N(6)-L-threonylcarbamoyladenosine(37)-C(2))-methylthiotran sferase [Minisyncoccus archaeiphilus]|uniref:tRNA (N(6)-L-threonylcarbamoyladenosine(37)-C(2))- methylthiotransferase n=1 Tax=Minisyncoccus archaeiphilus TaxID=3238481 RepID=UPI0009C982F6|nr:MAG: (Dimethylallyl)adenosine tRNA methylthiotransferase MiaB [Parcubacteria group bacterium ADurb.Bin216]GMX59736.1 MAG: tRNA (N(6)-L-threonylcarbamoyladenosine(37)-C(2))-methylthiotran sferase [Candidatus Parcubacteria bacterium]